MTDTAKQTKAKKAKIQGSGTEASRVLIRPAWIEDLPAIVKLLQDDDYSRERESLTTPLSPEYLRAFEAIEKDPNSEVIVAELEGRLIGTLQLNCIAQLSFRGSKVAQVESVRIASDLRGQGYGEELMEWALRRARELGCRKMQLTSLKVRKSAHRFYERLGFVASHEGMKINLD